MMALIRAEILTDLLKAGRELALLAGLRAAVAVVAAAGRQLSLSAEERQAILVRLQKALAPAA